MNVSWQVVRYCIDGGLPGEPATPSLCSAPAARQPVFVLSSSERHNQPDQPRPPGFYDQNRL
jgi:hypothetical protein